VINSFYVIDKLIAALFSVVSKKILRSISIKTIELMDRFALLRSR
jgi:hypothetical protein